MTIFEVGSIDKDTVDCPLFVAFKVAWQCEDSSTSYNLWQLTKRMHVESDEFDEEEAITNPVQRSTKTSAILFGVPNRVHIHLTLTSMCGIFIAWGGVGGGGYFTSSQRCCAGHISLSLKLYMYYNSLFFRWRTIFGKAKIRRFGTEKISVAFGHGLGWPHRNRLLQSLGGD